MTRVEIGKVIRRKCDEISQVMRSLSHPVRLKVLCSVLEQERGVNELSELCGVSQSAMSQFLKRMKAEGVLSSRRERNFIYYNISNKKLHALLRAVKDIYC